MLIKVYSGSPAGKLNLIENCSDVVVDMNSYTPAQNGDQARGGALDPVFWLDFYDSESVDTQNNKFIDFTDKNGVRTRLRVTAFAYICNNEGKTIEKVIAE